MGEVQESWRTHFGVEVEDGIAYYYEGEDMRAPAWPVLTDAHFVCDCGYRTRHEKQMAVHYIRQAKHRHSVSQQELRQIAWLNERGHDIEVPQAYKVRVVPDEEAKAG